MTGSSVESIEAQAVTGFQSANDLDSIPDGGFQAWVQVVGVFFLFLNTWGIVNSYGIFQNYYQTEHLAQHSPSAISWIGSIQTFLVLVIGVLTGPLYDTGYFRTLLVVGSFLTVFGMMMLSLSTLYWQVLLSQALCVGLGMGCLFVPSVAILSTYFNKNLGIAMGLGTSGGSLGGIIYPIIVTRLIPKVGFPWAVRVIGFIALGTLILSNVFMKSRVLPSATRSWSSLVELGAFKERPYALFVFGGFISYMGYYAPFYYLTPYAMAYEITTMDLATWLVSIFNAADFVGRILPNWVADYTGPLNVMIPFVICSGAIELGLVGSFDQSSLIALCVLFGFFTGPFISLPSTVLVTLTPDREKVGTRIGMALTCIAISMLVGTPIAGEILNRSGFANVWVFGGVTMIGGGLIMIASRLSITGLKLKAWA
ncbi:MFS general substrate transporter [Eremomyces bilateralis CBS 781.70]|uniref:MFS general substrate transporter n=1 Tax=Eremomyces bilateralis CBS 781.70 TaxID=1392243 RepID=A0A6G1FTL5_9PEZI|nr:MFS general substrate transporter [Eremomyces bilateralis CBS 781.70]KAF1809066.1 MFS general substrate transporter [Eremomyces bilateralis CBS 781.70]